MCFIRGLESAAENYNTPMLPQQETIESLTVMETIGTDQSLHTVSAKVTLSHLYSIIFY